MNNAENNSTGKTKAAAQSVVLDEYITPENLARELGASPRTLARWHTQRVGPPRTVIGRTILYRRESVEAWLRAREERPVTRSY